jgi:hypothetical protein
VREFEAPNDDAGGPTQTKRGVRCLASAPNAVTANQTLIQWLPKKRTIEDLLAVLEAAKYERLAGSESASVRVAYQVKTDVQWREERAAACGRTLEEAFGLENATWCQEKAQQALGLRLRTQPASIGELADGLHKKVIGKGFDKTGFALGVLERREEGWRVPQYIKEGLEWLEKQVGPKSTQEATAVIEEASADPTSAGATPESATS